jgi:hypothetical protein
MMSRSSTGVRLKFSQGRFLDLGVLPAGDHVVEFEVTNPSGTWLTLKSVSSSCGCTVATAVRSDLPPGRSLPVTLKLAVLPETRKTAYVFLHFGGETPMTDGLSVTFAGRSRSLLVPEVSVVTVEEVMPGTTVRSTLRCSAPGPPGESPAAIWTVGPKGDIDAGAQRILPGRDATIFEVDIESRAVAPGEVIEGTAELSVGVPPVATCRIPITIRARADLWSAPRIIARKVPEQSPVPFLLGRIEVHAMDPWVISEIRTSDWLMAKAMESDPSRGVEVWLKRRPGAERAVGQVVLEMTNAGERANLRTEVAAEF